MVSPRSDQFATLFEDITGRRRREEELSAKNEEMERFTYMVSHDLKSPLVTVRTFLGYLEQDLAQGLGERAAKDMGYIRDATARMGQLLEDLLAVSRVGRVVNPPVEVAYADLVRGALAAVAGAISARGVAVEVGGGSPHRYSLNDAILIKDNHIYAAGGIKVALGNIKKHAGHMLTVEIEVETLKQLEEVLKVGGADVVLLDNMSPATLKKAVAMARGKLVTEASGGVNLDNVAQIAKTGVDYISVGALTHSAQALDIGLDVEI